MRDKDHKGFALIITIYTISILIVMTITILSLLVDVNKDSRETGALLQSNIYYGDIGKYIKDKKGDQKVYDIIFSNEVNVKKKSGDGLLNMKCIPRYSGININWLNDNKRGESERYRHVLDIFTSISDKYDLEDSEELIYQFKKEINNNGFILSKGSFLRVLNRYFDKTEDVNIWKIRWGNIFIMEKNPKKKRRNKRVSLKRPTKHDNFEQRGDIHIESISYELVSLNFGLEMEEIQNGIAQYGSLKNYFMFSEYKFPEFYIEDGKNRGGICTVIYEYNRVNYSFEFKIEEERVYGFRYIGEKYER